MLSPISMAETTPQPPVALSVVLPLPQRILGHILRPSPVPSRCLAATLAYTSRYYGTCASERWEHGGFSSVAAHIIAPSRYSAARRSNRVSSLNLPNPRLQSLHSQPLNSPVLWLWSRCNSVPVQTLPHIEQAALAGLSMRNLSPVPLLA